MKKNLQMSTMLVAFAVIFGCGATTIFAQQSKAPKVGGYKIVSVEDAGVLAAAQFAVSEHSEKNEVSLEVVSIHKAARQLVQGFNYRMCVEVKVVEEDNDETQFVLITVYQNLKRFYKLSSWKPDGCSPQ